MRATPHRPATSITRTAVRLYRVLDYIVSLIISRDVLVRDYVRAPYKGKSISYTPTIVYYNGQVSILSLTLTQVYVYT